MLQVVVWIEKNTHTYLSRICALALHFPKIDNNLPRIYS